MRYIQTSTQILTKINIHLIFILEQLTHHNPGDRYDVVISNIEKVSFKWTYETQRTKRGPPSLQKIKILIESCNQVIVTFKNQCVSTFQNTYRLYIFREKMLL